MSVKGEKNAIQELLGNLESQLDEGTTNIIILPSSNQFEKACDDVLARIKSWKDGTFELSADEVKWAEDKITWIKQKHHSFLSKLNYLNSDITELRGRLRSEEERRKLENCELKGKITQLESDKLELRRVMIVRQLAQSVQYYMTKQFPADVFKTKFSHQCTFENIESKAGKSTDPNVQQIFTDISNKFIECGVDDLSDVGPMIKEIRELGTGVSHPNRMIRVNKLGVFEEFVPTVEDVRTIINEVDLPLDLKQYANILVDMLIKLVPPNTPIVYSKEA